MMTEREFAEIKDTHLMGPEDEYSDAERDIAALVDEVKLLKTYLEVRDEEKNNLIKEVNSARRTFGRCVGNFLRNCKAEDLTEVETRLMALTRLAKSVKELFKLKQGEDIDLGSYSSKGTEVMEVLYNNIDAVEALDIPLELEINGNKNYESKI